MKFYLYDDGWNQSILFVHSAELYYDITLDYSAWNWIDWLELEWLKEL